MSDRDVKLEVVGGSEFVKASDRPVMGERRLVRMLPTGLPGTSGILVPCIWMSEYTVPDEDLHVDVRVCLLLVGKGPPRPEIHCVRIPAVAIEKFPLAPVEW